MRIFGRFRGSSSQQLAPAKGDAVMTVSLQTDGPDSDSAGVQSTSSLALSPGSDRDVVPVSLKPPGVSILRQPGQVKEVTYNVRFNEVVTVRRTWAKRDYDRKVRAAPGPHPMRHCSAIADRTVAGLPVVFLWLQGEVTWKLTAEKAMEIRKELNDFKREMYIHEDSRQNTHFY